MTTILGIDPGLAGGFALLDGSRVDAQPFPLSGGEIDPQRLGEAWEAFGVIPGGTIAVIEKAFPMPKQGLSSTFTFGAGWGLLRGILAAKRIRTEIVVPQRWKAVILAGTAKDKAAAIAYCTRAFPSVSLIATAKSRKPHDGMADALCIAEFGRRSFLSADERGAAA